MKAVLSFDEMSLSVVPVNEDVDFAAFNFFYGLGHNRFGPKSAPRRTMWFFIPTVLDFDFLFKGPEVLAILLGKINFLF